MSGKIRAAGFYARVFVARENFFDGNFYPRILRGMPAVLRRRRRRNPARRRAVQKGVRSGSGEEPPAAELGGFDLTV